MSYSMVTIPMKIIYQVIYLLFLVTACSGQSSSSSCSLPSYWYRLDTVVVPVKNVADLYKRLNYPTTQHVTLELQNEITGVNLYMGQWFSNTTLLSRCGMKYQITSNAPDNIPIYIAGAQNVSIFKVAISVMVGNYSRGQPICTDKFQQLNIGGQYGRGYFFLFKPCPALMVQDSANIELGGNNFIGAVNVWNVQGCLVDGNYITFPSNQYSNSAGLFVSNYFNPIDWSSAPFIVRNNLIVNADGINVGGNSLAIGIQVTNNNITNFFYSGVRIDSGIGNYVAYNYIATRKGYPASANVRGLGIDAGRFGVNNIFTNNYMDVYRGTCLVSEGNSGGTTFDTNICLNCIQSYSNKGSWKLVIKNFLSFNPTFTSNGGTWCPTLANNLCSGGLPTPSPGIWYDKAPWVFDMCLNSSINGVACGGSSAVTGNCSGLPLLNDIDIATIGGKSDNVTLPSYSGSAFACPPYPSADQLNKYQSRDYGVSNVSTAVAMLSIIPGSKLALDYPALANFPFSQIGVLATDWTVFRGLQADRKQPDTSGSSTMPSSVNYSPYIISGTVVGSSLIVAALVYNSKKIRAKLSNKGHKPKQPESPTTTTNEELKDIKSNANLTSAGATIN